MGVSECLANLSYALHSAAQSVSVPPVVARSDDFFLLNDGLATSGHSLAAIGTLGTGVAPATAATSSFERPFSGPWPQTILEAAAHAEQQRWRMEQALLTSLVQPAVGGGMVDGARPWLPGARGGPPDARIYRPAPHSSLLGSW